MPKLRTLLLLGAAGGVVAAVRKRASADQIQQAASQAADKVGEPGPEPVRRAVDSAVKKATEAASGVPGGGASEDARDPTRRYAAPAEAGAQPPAESGGAPA